MESILPVDHDIVMKSINTDFENEIIDPSVLDDMELYLECEDDELNFVPANKQKHFLRKNVKLHVTFSPGTSNETTACRKCFKCSICDETFFTETKFKSHMIDLHNMSKPLKCDHCSLLYSSMKMLKRHYLLKHKQSLNIKRGTLPVTSLYDQGSINSTQITPYSCDKCSFTTCNIEILQKHISFIHGTGISVKGSYNCDKCKFMCKQKGTYRLHTRMHENVLKEYLCEVCGKNFLTYTQLSRHSKIHTSYKDHKCLHKGCNKFFKFQGSRTDHMKSVHNKQIKTVDDNCRVPKPEDSVELNVLLKERLKKKNAASSPSFIQDISVDGHYGESSSHQKIPNDEKNTNFIKNFKCNWPHCGKCFRDNFNLKLHMYTHTKTKTNKCPYCDFTYIQKASLNWHLKNKHWKNSDCLNVFEHSNNLTNDVRIVAQKTSDKEEVTKDNDAQFSKYTVLKKTMVDFSKTCGSDESFHKGIHSIIPSDKILCNCADYAISFRKKKISSNEAKVCCSEKYQKLRSNEHVSPESQRNTKIVGYDTGTTSANVLRLSNELVKESEINENHVINHSEDNSSRDKDLQISADLLADSNSNVDTSYSRGNAAYKDSDKHDHTTSNKQLKMEHTDNCNLRTHSPPKNTNYYGIQLPVEEDNFHFVDKKTNHKDNTIDHSSNGTIKKAIRISDATVIKFPVEVPSVNSTKDIIINKKSKRLHAKNFACTWPNCGKSFRDNFNLKSHYCTHTAVKTRVCPYCDFTFIQKSSLNWHLKTKHVLIK